MILRPVRVAALPYRTRAEWREALQGAGVQLNAYAETYLDDPEFPYGPWPLEVELVMGTVADLGFPEGADLAQLQQAALAQGLEPCPVLAALALRLAWADQPEGRIAREHRAPEGSVTVISHQFRDSKDLHGFYLIQAEGVPWLRGYVAPADHIWAPHDTLIWAKVGPL